MKNALLLLFFIYYCIQANAQVVIARPAIVLNAATDSAHAARTMMADALALAGSDTAQAIHLLRKAGAMFSRQQSSLNAGRCLIAIGDIFFNAGQYNRAFSNYLRAQDTLYETGAPEAGFAMLGVAKSQYHRGLYRFAIRSFSDAIESAVKYNNKPLKAAAEEYLGLVYFLLQSVEKGRVFFTSAFIHSTGLNDEPACLRLAEKLFDIHYFEKRYDSALWYAAYGCRLAEKLQRQNNLQGCQLNRIAALIRLHRPEQALAELTAFNEVQVTQSDLNAQVKYQALYGDYHMSIGDKTSADAWFAKAIANAEKTNTPDLLAVVYRRLADACAARKDYANAYHYAQVYHELMNSFYSNSIGHLSTIESLMREDIASNTIKYLHSTNRVKELQLLRELDMRRSLQNQNQLKDSILLKEQQLSQVLAMENKYKSDRLHSQELLSNALNRESAAQKSELKKQYWVRGLLSAGLVALFVMGAVAWRLYKKSQFKKKIIEKQAANLQVLMKEIHHRVKNNLQIISSLLDIQSMSLQNNNMAAEAIREGRNRVQSMALIHQYLYQEDNIRGIWVEDYIKTLTENLFASYNINPDKIKLETDIDRINLDVDSVIPVGLIINELVSNALKYAFNGVRTGTLFISLKQKENYLDLMVRDNGIGFPTTPGEIKEQSFGLQLIRAFAQKLKASLSFYNNNGAVISMQIKKYKLA
jgi:two-component system, sensor histidine kinase PdtaS